MCVAYNKAKQIQGLVGTHGERAEGEGKLVEGWGQRRSVVEV